MTKVEKDMVSQSLNDLSYITVEFNGRPYRYRFIWKTSNERRTKNCWGRKLTKLNNVFQYSLSCNRKWLQTDFAIKEQEIFMVNWISLWVNLTSLSKIKILKNKPFFQSAFMKLILSSDLQGIQWKPFGLYRFLWVLISHGEIM